MNDETVSAFAFAAAKEIASTAPDNLPALLLRRSRRVGSGIRICAVGDIGLSGRVAATAHQYGPDVLFAEVAPLLRTADITFGNLETPLASNIAPGKMFAAPASGAATLRKQGFKILHLANNHVGEYGQAGLAATLAAVHGSGILSLGAGISDTAARQLLRTDKNSVRIGWLGCGRTLLPQEETGSRYWEFNATELLDGVSAARPSVDVLIVSIHIGLMYMDYPRPEHKSMAEQLMEAGANLVLMHHAHVLQGVQVTAQGSICCYNLGNFLYDWQEGVVQTPVMLREQNEGAIFWFEIDKEGISLAAALPTRIDDDCRVRWATGEAGSAILRRLQRISRDLEGDFAALFERQRAQRNTGPILKVLAFHVKQGNWRYLIECLRRARFEHLKMLVRWIAGFSRAAPN